MGCLPPEDVGAYAPGSRWIRGLILMDMHRLDEAIAAFESVQAALPSFALNSVHLAGARFLKGDTTGACDALQKALDSTEMPDGTRKSAENLLSNLRKNLAAAKTARERGKLVEGLGAALLFLAGSLPDSSVSRRSVKFAVNGVLALLQEYYYREGLFAESIEAGRRLIASDPSGGAWFKDARARAAAGGKQSAVESLAKAVEMGFDEGRRMDEERVFEAVKAEARYGELRARCR
jgi:tetratricopeptide (TPR) repeat protein